ncbi:fragment of conserved hypothetical protein (part 2) [Bradyrhizobium sp. ORS 285]|nr:fragment of conserved hypothetical protein (part 2) [Bradyrhizobium sp. ORS 285]
MSDSDIRVPYCCGGDPGYRVRLRPLGFGGQVAHRAARVLRRVGKEAHAATPRRIVPTVSRVVTMVGTRRHAAVLCPPHGTIQAAPSKHTHVTDRP